MVLSRNSRNIYLLHICHLLEKITQKTNKQRKTTLVINQLFSVGEELFCFHFFNKTLIFFYPFVRWWSHKDVFLSVCIIK